MKVFAFISACLLMAACGQKNTGETQKIEGQGAPMSQTAGIKIDAGKLAQATDPICDMDVTKEVADTATYKGKLYGFCGTGCKEEFLKDPESHLKK